jgi:D-3-phosphoglycerate dehydrogenase
VCSSRIAGAGLDVFLKEPPELDHPLLHIDNVIVTPHNAGMTTESMLEMVTATAHQWIDVFHGKVPPRMVNPEVWPHYSERFTALLGFSPAPLT